MLMNICNTDRFCVAGALLDRVLQKWILKMALKLLIGRNLDQSELFETTRGQNIANMHLKRETDMTVPIR